MIRVAGVFFIFLSLFEAFGQDSAAVKNTFAIFPVVSYAPETSVQLGGVGILVLNKKQDSTSRFNRQSSLAPYFVYTFKQQSIVAFNVDNYFLNGQNLSARLRYFNFPDSYFGIGNDNDPDISEKYTNRFFQVEGQFLHPINDRLFIGLAFDLHTTSLKKIIPNGLLETDNPIGRSGGNLLGLGPAFRYDTRDYTIYPTEGYFISSRLVISAIGDFSFSRYVADFRKYIHVVNRKNIIAFQFQTQLTFGDNIPFYKLPQLGGDRQLRGISNASLYRDKQLAYAQIEYRRPLFWRFGMTVFAGLGDVAHELDEFNLSELKYVVGMGGRLAIIPKRKFNARLDLGMGRGGQIGIYVGVSEAF